MDTKTMVVAVAGVLVLGGSGTGVALAGSSGPAPPGDPESRAERDRGGARRRASSLERTGVTADTGFPAGRADLHPRDAGSRRGRRQGLGRRSGAAPAATAGVEPGRALRLLRQGTRADPLGRHRQLAVTLAGLGRGRAEVEAAAGQRDRQRRSVGPADRLLPGGGPRRRGRSERDGRTGHRHQGARRFPVACSHRNLLPRTGPGSSAPDTPGAAPILRSSGRFDIHGRQQPPKVPARCNRHPTDSQETVE